MAIRSLPSILLLLCLQQVLTRHASVNIRLDLSAHVSDDNNQLTQEMLRICMKETQLSMIELEHFKANELIDNEPDKSIQCFAHCIYEHLGIMKNGIFVDNDFSQKLLLPENLDYSTCRSIRGSSKCDTAYKIHMCIQKVKNGAGNHEPQSTSEQSVDVDTSSTANDESADNPNGQ